MILCMNTMFFVSDELYIHCIHSEMSLRQMVKFIYLRILTIKPVFHQLYFRVTKKAKLQTYFLREISLTLWQRQFSHYVL